jgi:DNA-3-methyladenine glycosylase I
VTTSDKNGPYRDGVIMPDGIVTGSDGRPRCWWSGDDSLYQTYHDAEWGWPVDDDHRLFEKLCLEGFQSGLSWLTILRKRPNFRRAFHDFDPARIADFDDTDVDRLMDDAGIVRNRAKILATINNARRYAELVEETGSLAAYLWSFEPDPATRPTRLDHQTLMTFGVSAESKAMSKDLRRRGWAFVGPTTAYAAMEAMGIVNDHLDGCWVGPAVEERRASFQRPPLRIRD